MSKGSGMQYAELVFSGGDIITMREECPRVEALAVAFGRIMRAGDEAHVSDLVGPDTQVVDLEGHTLLPGLVEPHSHPFLTALFNQWVDVSGFNNPSGSQVMEALRRGVEQAAPGVWVPAFGYDPILTRDLKTLTRDVLDQIAPDNPVYVLVQTMHTAYVNSKALQAAGISDSTPQPRGGTYVKDASSRLTGMIIEQGAMLPFLQALMTGTPMDAGAVMGRQLRAYARAGYTTVGGLGLFPPFPGGMELLKKLVEADNSPVRITYLDKVTDLEAGTAPDLGPGSLRFRKVGVKFWYDGSPYTGNMLLDEPYLETPLMQQGLGLPKGNSGYSMLPKSELLRLVRKYHNLGWQISIHGQGDRAIRDIIDVFEEVLADTPRQGHRHRIEHGALFPLDQLERAARLGLVPSWHINHIHYYGEALRDEIIGAQRAENLMPAASALRSGLRGSLHNDSPMYPPEPFKLLRTATTRLTRRNALIGPQQAVTTWEALRMITIDAAWQLLLEDHIGTLEHGKLADLVMLSHNPLLMPPAELHNIEVLGTWREGRPLQ